MYKAKNDLNFLTARAHELDAALEDKLQTTRRVAEVLTIAGDIMTMDYESDLPALEALRILIECPNIIEYIMEN